MAGPRLLETVSRFLRRPRRRDAEDLVAWARESAIMLDPVDWPNTSIDRLAVLDQLLEGKRVVYLGEEDHWIHEKNPYRLLLLRYLVSRGWTTIGEEFGASDGLRVNRYLNTGDETHLQRIATFGYRGALRTDRDDRPTGLLKDSSERYPVAAFAAEQTRFLRSLRSLAMSSSISGQHLSYFGFDLDVLAGGGYKDLIELLRPLQDETLVTNLLTLLARRPRESIDAEINRLNGALAVIDAQTPALRTLLGDTCFGQLRHWTRTLQDSLQFVRVANPAKDWRTLNRAMAAREQAMFRQVQFVLEQLGPDGKLVLMGHNRHLSKDIGAMHNTGGAPPGGNLVPSLGTLINRLLPGQVFSIWSLYDHGMSSQPYAWLSSQYQSTPGSLNAMLAEIGSVCLLPTVSPDPKARLLSREMDIHGIYNQIFRTAIAKQADVVFFLPNVSPLGQLHEHAANFCLGAENTN